jgi:hypothetical protein
LAFVPVIALQGDMMASVIGFLVPLPIWIDLSTSSWNITCSVLRIQFLFQLGERHCLRGP